MSRSRESSPHGWVLRSRRLLDASADHLDAGALSRLNRARQAALAQLDAPARRAPALLHWLGAGAVAAGLALVVWRGEGSDSDRRGIAALEAPPAVAAPSAAMPVAAPDFELLADPDNFALVEELEFYAWLEAEEGRGG